MPRLPFHGIVDDEFDDEDFELPEAYTGFEKIKHRSRGEEELRAGKKRSSLKHQKRPDKE